MNYRPVQDRIIVQPDSADNVTKSGIVIPDMATEKPQQGTILAIGPGRITQDGKLIELTVKVGDKVMYSKNAGQPVKVQDVEYVVMREDDVLAIVE